MTLRIFPTGAPGTYPKPQTNRQLYVEKFLEHFGVLGILEGYVGVLLEQPVENYINGLNLWNNWR